MTRAVLVRPPGPRLTDGLVTHIQRQPVDLDLARRQWENYVEVFAGRGWDVHQVPTAEDCPDAVFIEDTMVMFGGTAVMTRPGAPERRPEVDAVEAMVRTLGLPLQRVANVDAAAHLDGGDVLKIGRTVYVGRGGRTDDAGIAALATVIEPLGGTVIAVPVTRVLHLKSAVTALPDGTVLGWDPVVDETDVFDAYLSVPEESGAHVVVLDPDTVLMATSAPRTASLLRERGLDVIAVDISEYEKLEGCVTCLSVRIRP
ncbi:MAG: dimethylargininase [Actinomycetota bacterium]